jgi:6-phosphogluconate dehydrogenase (decarboxylating)
MAYRAGFVGLGNIGKPPAKRRVQRGLETTVFDIAEAPVRERVARGARAASPRELAWRPPLAREAGVSLPGTALASQIMARVDGLEDAKRR